MAGVGRVKERLGGACDNCGMFRRLSLLALCLTALSGCQDVLLLGLIENNNYRTTGRSISGWAISAAESCANGDATRSLTGSGKWRSASSENFFAMAWKICQSLFDSQHGGTAADKG